MNLVQLLDKTAREHPGKTALVEGGIRISYSDLRILVKEVAKRLKMNGLSEGDLVGIRLPNSIAYIVMTYAVWEAGAAVAPIAMEYRPSEVAEMLDKMGIRFLVSESPSAEAIPISGPNLRRECFLSKQNGLDEPFAAGSDVAFVRFTSGTTGAYKGVVLSHRTIFERIAAVNRGLRIGPKDTVVWNLSMAHHFVSTLVLYVSCAVKVVLVQGLLAESILAAAEEEGATVLYMSPFHFGLLAANHSIRQLSTVRLAISTTIELPENVLKDFYDRYRLPIGQAYGIIEVGLPCINTDEPLSKRGSVGRPIPGYEIQIRNRGAYREESYSCGEIFVRGPGFFDAYYNPFRKASQVMDDGWFDTGDVGWLDQDGYLYLLGRKKEIVNVAGMKVFPQEVEAVLNSHPGVLESRVFGKPHDQHGETITAEIVLSGQQSIAEADIKVHCRGLLAAYKVPDEIRFIERIEKTAVTSKIVRFREKNGDGDSSQEARSKRSCRS